MKAEKTDQTKTAVPKVTLADYVRRTRKIELDAWQLDLCARHEKAFWLSRASLFKFQEVNIGTGRSYVVAPSGFRIDLAEFTDRKGKGTRAAEHAPPQHGKSIIVSQCLPAWILGYDPIHRFRLATMSIEHSREFSEVVLRLMRSPEHRAIFTDPAGYPEEHGRIVKWFTAARRAVNDGQSSFTALGLQTGFVGTGADTLVMDDPYKSIEEALSEVIRAKTWRFYTDTARVRLDESSCAFIMFHRYHQDDIAGRAILSGEFDLWRYAAIADGEYVDDESGRVFPDPLGRADGEVLSVRKSPTYPRMQENEQVWYSQFQGRPSSKTGAMFDVSCFRFIHKDDVPPIYLIVRAWDNAATEEGEGASAYTAGVKKGIDASGNFYIFDVVRKQVGTDKREALQLATAESDGKLCPVRAPQDPGSAGKDVAFKFKQMLSAYQVETAPVTGTKQMRAYNYSVDVNTGKYFIVCDERSPVTGELIPPAWFKAFKEEHYYFPQSTTKDMVDAGSDGHKYLAELFYRGLVIKSFNPFVHLVSYQKFQSRFGEKLPDTWDVSAAVRISPDASKPSGWAITARAPENAKLGECVVLIASAKRYTPEPADILRELKEAFTKYLSKPPVTVWLSPESAAVGSLSAEKFQLHLSEFKHDSLVGIPETNWYMEVKSARHPFYERDEASKFIVLSDEGQLDNPTNELGQVSARQEAVTWGYNEKEEPQPFGGIVLDCARMMLYNFALRSMPLTKAERFEEQLQDHLKMSEIAKHVGTKRFVSDLSARQHMLGQLEAEEKTREQAEADTFKRLFGSPRVHGKYRRNR